MKERKEQISEQELDKLSERWDRTAYRAQGSPYEDISVAALAKSTGTKSWSRPGGKIKGDTVARYVYLSFEELIQVEKLDMRSANHLLEICEATFLFEEECDDLGSFVEIDNQAYQQRMRFVEEFGLFQDYPVALANLDSDLRELCSAEDITTFLDLMEFLDRLADKAWIGGSYKNLQNVFAHGDQKGLTRYFPYRLGHRGFHLPEALSFVLNRIRKSERDEVFEYHERRRKRGRLSRKMDLPKVIGDEIVLEILKCVKYFAARDPRLLVRLHDSAYLCRELMYLNDPQTERVLQWLLHLSLGIFKAPDEAQLNDEVQNLAAPNDIELVKSLKLLLEDATNAV